MFIPNSIADYVACTIREMVLDRRLNQTQVLVDDKWLIFRMEQNGIRVFWSKEPTKVSEN